MEYQFEINQYVTLNNRNGQILDRKQRKKFGKLVNVYLVDFSKTHSATVAKFRVKLAYWYKEDEIDALVSGHDSNFEIWVDAMKRLIKNITGYEFNRQTTR